MTDARTFAVAILATLCTVSIGLGQSAGRAGRDAAPVDAPPARRVVLTFDDVPATGPPECSAAEVDDITDSLLSSLAAQDVPAVAFVVESRACGADPHGMLVRTVNRWIEAGHEIGNHTASHLDINNVDLGVYFADIEQGGRVVDSLLLARGRTDRYFRPPYLHMGPNPEKREALRKYLDDAGYRVGAVTMDNQEWVYERAYQFALARNDGELADRVVAGYLEHLGDVFAYYEELSIAFLGREIPQILLLHANRLNADHVGRVIEALRARGYEFITLDTALADPAYELPDHYVGPRGLSWLQRWALSDGHEVPPEPREAPWVAGVTGN